MNNENFYKISTQGAIDYLSATVETYNQRIRENHPEKRLYEESILFLEKAISVMKEKLAEENAVSPNGSCTEEIL